MLKQLIKDYLNKLTPEKLLLEDFNEKSLQHNLGQYLNDSLGKDYVVQHERNIKYFKSLEGISKSLKSEIDLVVLKKTNPKQLHVVGKPIFVIELKFIKAFDQYLQTKTASPTKALYEFLYDIEFIEQCKKAVIEAALLILSDYNIVHSEMDFVKGRKPKYVSLWEAFRKGLNLTADRMVAINKESKQDNIIEFEFCPSLSWKRLFVYEDEAGHKELELKYIIN